MHAFISSNLKAAVIVGAAGLLAACQAQGGTSPFVGSASLVAPQKIVDGASGQSVAYQVNVEHTGFAAGPLRLPLQKLWKLNFGEHGYVGYPVIANGIVVVTVGRDLIALDEKTGKKLWSRRAPRQSHWVGPAYDNGAIFVDPSETALNRKDQPGIYAFDEKTGTEIWSKRSPGQWGFSTPPTAAYGSVYTSAAGDAGTLYAYDEKTGALKWTDEVANGDESSPVVTPNGIFVSYACPQTYDFQPDTGKQIWHYSPGCDGGGGSTPALYKGLLFVGDYYANSAYNGTIFNATNGHLVGGFVGAVPAFAHDLGFFVYGSTLTARSIPQMKQVWTAKLTGSGYYGFNSPPLIVDNTTFVTTVENYLVGYDAKTGKQKMMVRLENIGYNDYRTSLGFGDGELVVPDGTQLLAFKGS